MRTVPAHFSFFILVNTLFLLFSFNNKGGWSGGAMVLGNLPVPGRPTVWMIVWQGPTAVGVVWTFFLLSILSLLCLPLFGRRSDID